MTKKKLFLIFSLGTILAILVALLKIFEYKYFIGSFSTQTYTSIVAILFTSLGIWLGVSIFTNKTNTEAETSNIRPSANNEDIDIEKLENYNLNNREYEILKLISKGHSNKEIAEKLFITISTVKTHTSNLYSKLDVKSRTQAAHKALKDKLL